MTSREERRQGVKELIRLGVSQRRACFLAELARSSFHYTARLDPEEAALVERLHGIAARHPRYGYRRVWALLRREGVAVNPKRVWRLWKEQGLAVRKRPKKKRQVRTGQSVPCQAQHPNHVWTYDFIQDTCLNGTQLKMLTVEDEFTRECLRIEVASSLPSAKVIRVLSGLFALYGSPRFLRSDNGPEFIAQALKAWLHVQGTDTLYIDPGSPWQNGYAESFNGKFRDECLNSEVFVSVAEARVRVETFRRHYNEERPHSSLGYLTPSEFKERWRAAREHLSDRT
jgi:putative transposase